MTTAEQFAKTISKRLLDHVQTFATKKPPTRRHHMDCFMRGFGPGPGFHPKDLMDMITTEKVILPIETLNTLLEGNHQNLEALLWAHDLSYRATFVTQNGLHDLFSQTLKNEDLFQTTTPEDIEEAVHSTQTTLATQPETQDIYKAILFLREANLNVRALQEQQDDYDYARHIADPLQGLAGAAAHLPLEIVHSLKTDIPLSKEIMSAVTTLETAKDPNKTTTSFSTPSLDELVAGLITILNGSEKKEAILNKLETKLGICSLRPTMTPNQLMATLLRAIPRDRLKTEETSFKLAIKEILGIHTETKVPVMLTPEETVAALKTMSKDDQKLYIRTIMEAFI